MPKTPEEFLEEAKELIGAETELERYPYPVEYDSIRRYCHMTEDPNPLFMDPAYAQASGYRDALCPPTMVEYFVKENLWPPSSKPASALPRVATPGERNINLTRELEFYKPIVVGDRISYKRRIAEVYIKPIRLDAKAFWTKIETLIYNQDGDMVAKMTNLGLRHRTPEQIAEAGE